MTSGISRLTYDNIMNFQFDQWQHQYLPVWQMTTSGITSSANFKIRISKANFYPCWNGKHVILLIHVYTWKPFQALNVDAESVEETINACRLLSFTGCSPDYWIIGKRLSKHTQKRKPNEYNPQQFKDNCNTQKFGNSSSARSYKKKKKSKHLLFHFHISTPYPPNKTMK